MDTPQNTKYVYYPARISRIEKPFGDTRTFFVTTNGGERPPFTAGHSLHLVAPGAPLEKPFVRHMSIAALPDDEELVFSMDLSSGSPYKELFRKAEVGDEVTLFKVRGHFVVEDLPEGTRIVFIAGGIGITPVRSLIRRIEIGRLDLPWRLVYVGRNYLFRDEFSSYPNPQEYIGRADVPGALDRLTADAAGVPGAGETRYFVTGSHSFVESLSEELMKRGAAEHQIRTEDFR